MYLVCGEALYDVLIDPTGPASPNKVSLSAKAGGSPHNVAIGLARLGCPVALATEIAPDTLGRRLESRLAAEGVDCSFLRRTGKATPLAMVDVDALGNARYVFHGLDCILFHPDPKTIKPNWKSIYGVHVGSIPIVSRQSSAMLLDLLRTAPKGIINSFDPNVRTAFEPDIERWRISVESFGKLAHLIKASEEDLKTIYGADVDEGVIAQRWLSAHCSLVIVTRGGRGASLYSRSAGRIDVPAVKVIVADTVGAGDSFQAAMLAWLAEKRLASPSALAKLSPEQLGALGHFSAQAAAITCRHRGPEFPYRKALQDPPAKSAGR
ncbi:MAG: carbohydrate kinase [Pseudomonadota bacterium]|nr:carbohydrate kinase [Pseudomonadota bacterium]